MSKWSEHLKQVQAMRAELKERVYNVGEALEFWELLSSADGDMRSGVELSNLFRPLIVSPMDSSSEAAETYAKLFRELHRNSGESPKIESVGSEIARVLEASTSRSPDVAWVLSHLH
jgi:hypothetical protein